MRYLNVDFCKIISRSFEENISLISLCLENIFLKLIKTPIHIAIHTNTPADFPDYSMSSNILKTKGFYFYFVEEWSHHLQGRMLWFIPFIPNNPILNSRVISPRPITYTRMRSLNFLYASIINIEPYDKIRSKKMIEMTRRSRKE